jgi:hypothetical protein
VRRARRLRERHRKGWCGGCLCWTGSKGTAITSEALRGLVWGLLVWDLCAGGMSAVELPAASERSPALKHAVLARCSTSNARLCSLELPHNKLELPIFMPVGTVQLCAAARRQSQLRGVRASPPAGVRVPTRACVPRSPSLTPVPSLPAPPCPRLLMTPGSSSQRANC